MPDPTQKDSKSGILQRPITKPSRRSVTEVRVENEVGTVKCYDCQANTTVQGILDAFLRDTGELLRCEIYRNGVRLTPSATVKSLGKVKSGEQLKLEVRRFLDPKRETTDTDEDKKPVLITVKTADAIAAPYRVPPNGFLRQTLNDFKNKYISPTAVLKFRFNGVPISQDDTPATLGMTDHNEHYEIEVFEPQTGGTCLSVRVR